MPSAAQRESLPGTRPEGVRDEREAGLRVRDMFARIAPRYDFLNHLLSFSLDRLWRRRTARLFSSILGRPEARVLDVCCGTGDLSLALARRRARRVEGGPPVVGADFVEGMLVRAAEKSRAGSHGAVFAGADALSLPFADASFDLLTAAFGFRNLSNYQRGLCEFARVLRPGGEVGILEFSEPERGLLAGPFRFYFRHVLPRIGGAISGDKQAYAYLPISVSKFPPRDEFAGLMARCGFTAVRIYSWNFGSVVLHRARRDRAAVEPAPSADEAAQTH